MCYMTRQLFPSPSQRALICAGGGEEGRLAAAPASIEAERMHPAPHFGVWTRSFALSSWLLDPFGDPAPAGRAEPAEGDGTLLSVLGTALVEGWGSSAVYLRQWSSLQPGSACVPVAAAGGRLSGERGKATEFRSPRVGSRAGVSVVELVCSLFLSWGARNPFSDQRALAVLKVPGRGKGSSAPLGT